MYKSFKNKKFYLAFNTFPKTAKEVSKVYHTGIRNWEADDSSNYSIVLGTFRIIFAINKPEFDECPS
jgi:hypothetical protein